MAVESLVHVGIVVEDLRDAIDFFTELGLELDGEGQVEGDWVDRVNGVEGVRAEMAMMNTPDGDGTLELIRFSSPDGPAPDATAPTNVPGIRHVLFRVDDLDDTVSRLQARGGELVGTVEEYAGIYRLCFMRGPAGIIIELAQKIG